ncbi:MAG: hypothetical protein AB1744_14590, partial [Candidatus Zixiibacteriota bacterium]
MLTEEGLSRARCMESQSHFFVELLETMTSGSAEGISQRETNYLVSAEEFFDTILFGAGDYENATS